MGNELIRKLLLGSRSRRGMQEKVRGKKLKAKKKQKKGEKRYI